MPAAFKPLTEFAPNIDIGVGSMGAALPPLDFDPNLFIAPIAAPSGLFAIGDAGSGSAGSLNLLSGGGAAAPAPTTVSSADSALTIKITWDASVAAAPSGFMAGVIAAARSFEADFSNAVTLNIDVGYGEIAGTAMGGGALGESESYLQSVSYTALVAALKSRPNDPAAAAAAASLPAMAPVGGYLWVTTAQAKALGLAAANGTGLDGYIGFSSTYGFTYNNANGVASGTYDFNGIAAHELSEVMGRILLTGTTIGSYRGSNTLLDLMHYSAPGVRDFSASTPGYFSDNGGVTNGGAFNTVAGGDAGDWASSMGNNAYNAYSNSGVVNAVTSGDLTLMNALGWVPNTTTPAPKPVVPSPSGVSVTPLGASLAAAMGATGLAAKSALATIAAVGGAAGDPVSYTLGSTGAASFALTTNANGTATLAAGSNLVTGSAKGTLYNLTLTATDTATGSSSTASPLNVIVATGSGNTVSVATLVGAASTATPTFIYADGRGDLLNGLGMSGKLWFAAGPGGGDLMYGGSGSNTYRFGATADSTPNAMDDIVNFSAGKDFIDLTGISPAHLTFTGSLLGNSVAANSIGFQISGFNTFVYVNTSSATEYLASANMKIELSGWVTLGANNIMHG